MSRAKPWPHCLFEAFCCRLHQTFTPPPLIGGSSPFFGNQGRVLVSAGRGGLPTRLRRQARGLSHIKQIVKLFEQIGLKYKNGKKWRIWTQKLHFSPVPDGNHGDNKFLPSPMNAPVSSRPRISIELSAPVSLLLDHVADVTGATKAQVINAALLDALPGLLERADVLQKRSVALTQSQSQKKR